MKTNYYLAMFCALFSMPVSIAWATEPMGSHSEIVRVFRVLWGDTVESRVDVVDAAATTNDSKIDALNAQLESLGVIPITSSFISAGTITLSTAGYYTLAEDLTANIDITASCISLDLNHRLLTGVVTVDGGGSDITDLEVHNGFVLPPVPSSAPFAGITVASGVSGLNIFDVVMLCADTSASAVAGRSCMQIAGDEVTITNCHITAGAAGNATSGAGFDGGDGIELTSTSINAIIRDCAIFSGNGGDTNSGSAAGRGGYGIYVNGASNAQIADCLVLRTGIGGDNVNANGGDGGDGVHITSTSDDIEVTGCTMRNTGAGGAGGSGGVAGTNGKAMNDLVPAADPGKSIILSNIGHNIANTSIRFEIGAAGEKGVALTYPPTTTAVNVYANVYVV